MATLETPFAIGQQFWAPVSTPHQVTIPCPVCAGDRILTVILGNDERVQVECEACTLGAGSAPRGVVQEWSYEPGAEARVIASVESFSASRGWQVRTDVDSVCDFKDLYATEAEALQVSQERGAGQVERNMKSRMHKRTGAKNAGWRIRYHREQIADHERSIAWHRSKIEAKRAPAGETAVTS